MEYNDLLLSRHLDQLQADEINEEKFTARLAEATEEFKAGEYKYQCEVIDNMTEDSFLDYAIREVINGSTVKMNEIFESSLQRVIVNYEGEE